MDFVPIVVAGAMIFTAMSILKAAKAGLWGDVATIAVAVLIGVAVAFGLRASDFATGIDVSGIALADLNGASTVFFGFALSSVARTGYETLKAVDSNRSTAEPKLFENNPPA